MNHDKFKEAYTEALLKLAVNENHAKEMAEIPHDDELTGLYKFSKVHERRMKRLFARERRREAYGRLGKASMRTAAVLVIIIAVSFITMLLNPQIRAGFGKIFLKWFSTHTTFSFDTEAIDNRDIRWIPSYLPDGYMETKWYAYGPTVTVEFTNEDNDMITLKQELFHEISELYFYDNPNYEMHFAENARDYYVLKADSTESPVTVMWNQIGFVFELTGFMDLDEALKIAASLVITNEWYPTYVPEGFEEIRHDVSNSDTYIEMKNESSDRVVIHYAMGGFNGLSFDNEHSTYEVFIEDGVDYHIFRSISNEYPSKIVWASKSFMFYLTAYIDTDEAIKMAVSVREKK